MNRKRFLWLVFIGTSMFSNFALLSNVWTQVPKKAQITFSSRRNGNAEIYMMNIDGKNPRNLTNHPGFDYSPACSPDGRRIAFYSARQEGEGLYMMDADGENQHYLAPMDSAANPAWSPDGKNIAFDCPVGRRVDICVIAADGGESHNLTPHPLGDQPFDDQHPTWSPDGKQIAFQSSNNNNIDIYVMKVDGTDRRRLTRDPAHDRYPSWSPDGKKILFYSERDGRTGEVYVMDAHGNNQQNLTNHIASDGLWGASWFDPRFALSVPPIGKHIVSWGWLKRLGR